MTTRARLLRIWTDENFRGDRNDALRMAMAESAEQTDLVGFDGCEVAEPTPSSKFGPDHPNQLTFTLF